MQKKNIFILIVNDFSSLENFFFSIKYYILHLLFIISCICMDYSHGFLAYIHSIFAACVSASWNSRL